jgi:hypothetical protein
MGLVLAIQDTSIKKGSLARVTQFRFDFDHSSRRFPFRLDHYSIRVFVAL